MAKMDKINNYDLVKSIVLQMKTTACWYRNGPTTGRVIELGAVLDRFANEIEIALDYEELPYLTEEVVTYVRKFNPDYDQDASCVCGHPYSRHFDWSNDDDPCGCKYCGCDTFETPDEAVD